MCRCYRKQITRFCSQGHGRDKWSQIFVRLHKQTEKSKLRPRGTPTRCGDISKSKKNDQQKCNSINNTITVQMYKVNKKWCTGVSDENHCAPNKTTKPRSHFFWAHFIALLYLASFADLRKYLQKVPQQINKKKTLAPRLIN